MEGISRDLFPILDQKPYFNTCSIGPLAKPVKHALEGFLEDWNVYGGFSWVREGGWTDQVEQARELFAKLIGANPKNIAYSFGNSVAFSSILSGFDFNEGDNLVYNELDFPSFPSYIMAQAEKQIEYRVIEETDGLIDVQDYKSAIDEQTKLLTGCEVASNTGARLNSKELVELGHEHDIPVFIDTYQSTGVIPTDVKSLDIDFLASGCLKWLVGGFGISFLYIRDDWLEKLNPSSIGWMGIEDPFQDLYDKLRTELHRPTDATKFQYGTPYPFGAASAVEGMKIIDNVGINRIFQHDMEITEEIISAAHERELAVQTPVKPDKRGSIVNIKVKNASSVVEVLQEEGFVLDMRSNGIRLAPHFFTNSEDILTLFDRLDQFSELK